MWKWLLGRQVLQDEKVNEGVVYLIGGAVLCVLLLFLYAGVVELVRYVL